jgi:hypothetical protein
VLGAVFTELLFEWLRAWGEVRMVVFALLVIVVARAYPTGLTGLTGALGRRVAARVPRIAPFLTPRRLGD